MTTKKHDPFIQKAIEYWLDGVNELGYQPLFCEWLITSKYDLFHSVKYTGNEFGKDVIAKDPQGHICAYQLKGGDITTDNLRLIIKPEIDVMMDTPIRCPGIKQCMPDKVYLVTNGILKGTVPEEIVRMNEGKWKKNPLIIIDRPKLLKAFLEMADGFLPTNRDFYKDMVNLIFENDESVPNFEKIYQFLAQIINIDNEGVNLAQRKRDISTAILYTYMITGAYRTKENYVSIVQILTILISLIFQLVEKYNLKDNIWLSSYQMVWRDLIGCAKKVEEEVEEEGFCKSFIDPLYKNLETTRKHLAISIIFPLKLSEIINGNNVKIDAEKYRGTISTLYEGSLVPLIIFYLLVRSINKGVVDNSVILMALDLLIQLNSSIDDNTFPLLPPYFEINEIIDFLYGISDEKLEINNYRGSSYLIKSLIQLLVRSGDKQSLVTRWSKITFVQMEEFIPEKTIDHYCWRNRKGENLTTIPKHKQIWDELLIDSSQDYSLKLPKNLLRFPEFLPFFLSVFTHRANCTTVGYLDQLLSKSKT